MSELLKSSWKIIAANGEIVVCAEDMNLACEKSDYFNKLTTVSMRESDSKIILKPDWSIKVTESIVHLLTGQKVMFSIHEIYELYEALNQILMENSVEVRVQLNPKDISFPEPMMLNRLMDEVSSVDFEQLSIASKSTAATAVTFVIPSKIFGFKIWAWLIELLNSKVTVVPLNPTLDPKGPIFIGEILTPQLECIWKKSLDEKMLRPKISNSFMDYLFASTDPFFSATGDITAKISALSLEQDRASIILCFVKAYQCYSEKTSDKKIFTNEKFSLRFCSNFSNWGPVYPGSQDQGIEFQLFKPKDSKLGFYLKRDNNFTLLCPTYHGTPKSLLDVSLKLLSENKSFPCSTTAIDESQCSLRIAAPSLDTLKKLLYAIGKLGSNPHTIGVDCESNCFYAVKTASDMQLLLQHMAKEHHIDENAQVPTVTLLSQADGVF